MPKKFGKLPPIKSPKKSPKKSHKKILISPSILEERLKKERTIDLLDVSYIDHVPCSFGHSEKIRNFTPEEIEESILNTLATQQSKLFKDESIKNNISDNEKIIKIIDAGMKICANIYHVIELQMSESENESLGDKSLEDELQHESQKNESLGDKSLGDGPLGDKSYGDKLQHESQKNESENESQKNESLGDELQRSESENKLKTNLIKTFRELWVPDIICESIIKYLFVFLKDDKQLPWETFKQFFQTTLNVKILTAIFLLTESYIQHTIFKNLKNTKYEKKYIGDYINDQTNYLKRMTQNIIIAVDDENNNNSNNNLNNNNKKSKNKKKLYVPGLVRYNEKNYIDLIMLSEILLLDMISLNIGYDTYEIGKTIWEVFND